MTFSATLIYYILLLQPTSSFTLIRPQNINIHTNRDENKLKITREHVNLKQNVYSEEVATLIMTLIGRVRERRKEN